MKRKFLCAAFLVVIIVGLSVFYGCSDKNTTAGTDPSSKWETVIDFQYDKVIVSPDSNYIIVKKDNKYGAYYKNGDGYQLICSPKYESIAWSTNGGAIFAKSEGKTEILDHQNHPLVREKFAKVTDGTRDNGFVASVDGQFYGYLSRSNKWILPAEYLWITPVTQERFIISLHDHTQNLVNDKNESMIPDTLKLDYQEDLSGNISDRYLIAENKQTQLKGIINLDGKLILPTEYKNIEIREDEEKNVYFITEDLSEHLSLRNDSGTVLLPAADYQYIDLISKELFIVRKQAWWGLIDKNGQELLPIQYSKITIPPTSDIGFVKKAEEGWFIDKRGNRISKETYQDSSFAPSGLIKIQQNDKTGYLKKDASSYIPCLYDYGDDDFSDELLLVSKNQKLGFLDREGNVAIDFVYDFASPFQDGYALVIQGQKLGVINTKGELVVPFEFEAPKNPRALPNNKAGAERNIMSPRSNKIYPVQKGEKWGCIKMN